jgi:hypothetical protein
VLEREREGGREEKERRRSESAVVVVVVEGGRLSSPADFEKKTSEKATTDLE